MVKTVTEYKTDLGGNTTVEYSDGSTNSFNITDAVTAQVNPVTGGGIEVSIGGKSNFVNFRSPNKYKSQRSQSGFVDVATNAAYRDRTYRTIITSAKPVIAVQLVLRNPGATSVTWDGGVYATVSEVGNGNSNAGYSWFQFKFGGSASGVIPAGKGTIAGRDCVPGRLVSDWLELRSIPRTDGSSLHAVVISGYASLAMGSITLAMNASQLLSEWADINNADVAGRTIETRAQTGNKATANDFSGDISNWSNPFYEVNFLHESPVMTILSVGDSITNGDNGTSFKMASPVHFAATSLHTDNTPVQASNHGFSSQESVSFVRRTEQVLSEGAPPTAVVYSSWTPNEYADYKGVHFAEAKMWENMVVAHRATINAGAQFVVSTGTPANLSDSDEIIRVRHNEMVKAFSKQTGAILVDYDAVVRNPAIPKQLLPAFATDAIHPNIAGYKAMGNELARVLAAVKSAFFA